MKKISVIKFGGSISKNPKAWKRFLDDVAVLSKRESIILVHGGGPEVSAWLKKIGVRTRFVGGLRYTDKDTLEVVEMVLSGKVNKSIVKEFLKRKVNAVGISAKDGNICVSRRIKKLGFVGEPVKVNTSLLKSLVQSGYLPVVSSLSVDAKGQTLNVNADSIAMGIASGLKAGRLMLFTDVKGILNKNKKTIPVIKTREIGKLVKNGVITGGMIPKVRACINSIKAGVREVDIACGISGIRKLAGTRIVR